MLIDLDVKFHGLKLLFEDYLPKIIRGAGNCESLILRVKFLCLKYGRTHGMCALNCYDYVAAMQRRCALKKRVCAGLQRLRNDGLITINNNNLLFL